MTKQIINVGATANDRNGDSLRVAFQKVNTNFTELYTALGLDDLTLNLGAFEFNSSVMTTTDSTPIVIDQATTITSNLTVGGDILPSVANGGDLGSLARPWNSLYISNNTMYLGGIPLRLDTNNNLTVNGLPITGGGSSVTTGATAPTSPSLGDLWYDTNSGRTYVYYDASWVDANPVDGTGSSFSISNFGEGFSLNAADKVVTNKLYSTNETQPNQHYRLTLDTNGVVHLPDESIINGATLKSVPGNYAGITAGPVGHDEDSWMWVDPTGAFIATDYSTNAYQWQFGTDGALTLPSGARISNVTTGFNQTFTTNGSGGTSAGQDSLTVGIANPAWAAAIAANPGNYYIRFAYDDYEGQSTIGAISGPALGTNVYTLTGTWSADGGGFPIIITSNDYVSVTDINSNSGARITTDGGSWTFDKDGVLTLPGVPSPNFFYDRGTINYQPSQWQAVQTVGTTIHGFPGAATGAWKFNKTLYEFDFTMVKPGDTLMLDNSDVGYLDPHGTRGYPASISVSQQDPDDEDLWIIGTTQAGPDLPDGTTMWLKYGDEHIVLNDAWGFSNSSVSLPNNAKFKINDQEWTFGDNGSLTVPGTITKGDALQLVSGGTETSYTASVNVYGALGRVLLRTDNGTSSKDWEFNIDGSTTFPNSTTIADAVETITYNAINSLSYESGHIGTFATLNLDATDPISVGSGWIVNGPGVTDGVVNGTDTLVHTVSINTSTGNAFIDGESYTFTSPTPLSVGSKITVNNNDWAFGADGTTTFPKGGTILDISGYGPGLSTGFFDPNGITVGTAAGNDITFTPNNGVGLYSNGNLWTFGSDAILSLPQCGAVGAAVIQPNNTTFGIKLISNGNTFAFGTDGSLTLPNNAIIGRSDIGEITTAETTYTDSLVAWEAVRDSYQEQADSLGITSTGWPFIGWHATGTTAAGLLSELLTAWQVQNNAPSSPPTPLIFQPAISHATYDELRTALIAVRDSYNAWQGLLTSVKITAGTESVTLLSDGKVVVPNIIQTDPEEDLVIRTRYAATSSPPGTPSYTNKNFTFGTNGSLTFPDSTVQTTAYQKVAVPTHSYGATGDKVGMVAFDGDYIYYCKQNYVDNSTNIWVRVAWTGTTW